MDPMSSNIEVHHAWPTEVLEAAVVLRRAYLAPNPNPFELEQLGDALVDVVTKRYSSAAETLPAPPPYVDPFESPQHAPVSECVRSDLDEVTRLPLELA